MQQAMFAAKVTMATTIMLMALTGNGAWLIDEGQEDVGVLAQAPATMFPNGFTHDFGKVQRGIQARHAFRVVNTSDVPLRVVSLRWS
jgi:hypothetical protein